MERQIEVLDDKPNNKKKYTILIICLLVIIIILILLFFIIKNINDKKFIKETTNIINNKESKIIFINNDYNKCNYCNKVEEILKDKEIDYISYNISVAKDEYDKLLNKFSIGKDIINPPALIYIRNGKMFSNIINIDNTNVVKKFIEDYEVNNK